MIQFGEKHEKHIKALSEMGYPFKLGGSSLYHRVFDSHGHPGCCRGPACVALQSAHSSRDLRVTTYEISWLNASGKDS